MIEQIALVGYSGHAYVVAEAIELSGHKLIGYFEREQSSLNHFRLPYLGFEGNYENLAIVIANSGKFFVGIGDNRVRRRVLNDLRAAGLQTTLIAHPRSEISPRAILGEGTFVAVGAKINTLATIGEGVILNTGCIVDHECSVGNFVHVAPGAVLAGNVEVGNEAFIGAGAVVKQGITIGSNAIIGAGAVVLRDVPNNQIWFGNPARPYIK
ncbi:acetyltransferase [Pontibacter sp. E15-1]|uniref:acetyltransferase n=1 Tax=Pontibacter sp. E15-1 TaxID=2919918 RepID=UPI001F4F8899|nr:acetyltransferase [Pontibacter sp. E15-1]MCJ8166414.1 acetyltransferase [Pontibacter sp. E15-1]